MILVGERPTVLFGNGIRLPLSLRVDDTLMLNIGSRGLIEVRNISHIEKGVAGIDFPTDGPPSLERTYMVLVMFGGARIVIGN